MGVRIIYLAATRCFITMVSCVLAPSVVKTLLATTPSSVSSPHSSDTSSEQVEQLEHVASYCQTIPGLLKIKTMFLEIDRFLKPILTYKGTPKYTSSISYIEASSVKEM